jgi:uncharacterized membrane protein
VLATKANHKNHKKKYAIISIVFLFFLSALAMLKQLMSHHYFSCFMSDTYQYTSWASQFIDALKEGIIYPRWTPLNFWGYGNPTFIFYPPLAFCMVAVFYILSDSLIFAMNFTKFFSFFVSASGIFLLLREIYDEKVAFISGIFYIVFPFYIFDTYIGGSFPSSISLMWFPLILFFIYKYIRRREYLYLLYAGVCYGGLILTHIINAYMFTFIIIAFIIYMSIAKRRPEYLFAVPVVFAIGLAISSAYLFPFIHEKYFINYQSELEIFPLGHFFILPKYTNDFRPDFFWRALYNQYLSYVILFFVITLLIFFRILKSDHLIIKKDINTFNRFLIGVSFLSLFLLFGPSIFLYEAIPFFKHILPVRWLIITAFAVVLLFSSFIYILEILSVSKFRRYSLLVVIFLVCFLQDYKYISNACSFDQRELFPAKAINWVSWYLPKGISVNSLERDGGLKEKVVVIKGEGDYKVVKWESAKRIVEITANQASILRIRTLNFPGWTVYIDGAKTEIKTEDGTGAMLINIPPGRHMLILRFADTPIVYYSKIISLASFSCVIILVIFQKRKIYGRELDNKPI